MHIRNNTRKDVIDMVLSLILHHLNCYKEGKEAYHNEDGQISTDALSGTSCIVCWKNTV